jgi:hypothetical protein
MDDKFFWSGVGIIAVLGCIVAGGWSACSAAQTARSLAITSDACVALANAYRRDDIANMCLVSRDLAPLIDQLLGEAQVARGCEK